MTLACPPLSPLGNSECPAPLKIKQQLGENVSHLLYFNMLKTEARKRQNSLLCDKKGCQVSCKVFSDESPPPIFCFAQGACSGQWNHRWIRYTCKPYSIQGDFLQYGQRCWTSMKRRALGGLILVFYFIFFTLVTCHKSDLWMYCNLQNSFCSRLNLWYVNKVFHYDKDQKVNFIFLNIFYTHKVFYYMLFFPKECQAFCQENVCIAKQYVLYLGLELVNYINGTKHNWFVFSA